MKARPETVEEKRPSKSVPAERDALEGYFERRRTESPKSAFRTCDLGHLDPSVFGLEDRDQISDRIRRGSRRVRATIAKREDSRRSIEEAHWRTANRNEPRVSL
jgi:hypothetical protein